MSTLCSPVSYPPGISPRTIFPPWCISGKQHFCQAVPGPTCLLPTSPPYDFAHSRTSFFPHRAQHLSASGHMDPVDRNQFSSDNRCGETSTRLQGEGLGRRSSEVFEHTIIHSLGAGTRGGENSKSASVPGYATLIIAEKTRSSRRGTGCQSCQGSTLWSREESISCPSDRGSGFFFWEPNGLFL